MIVTGVSEGSESGSGTGSGWEEERRRSARWVLHLLLLGLEKESEEWVLDFAEKNNIGLGFWFLQEEEKKSEVGDKPKTKAMSTVCVSVLFFFFIPFSNELILRSALWTVII